MITGFSLSIWTPYLAKLVLKFKHVHFDNQRYAKGSDGMAKSVKPDLTANQVADLI